MYKPDTAILISIQPKWCELIANGKKTIEVRKTRPKLETPFKCYIYCTKEKGLGDILWCSGTIGKMADKSNGKVIGEFVCDKITELAPINHSPENVEESACLTRVEIVRYLKGEGYAWHISDLVIYDKPKELSEFEKPKEYPKGYFDGLTRPPQSWCYVEPLRE